LCAGFFLYSCIAGTMPGFFLYSCMIFAARGLLIDIRFLRFWTKINAFLTPSIKIDKIKMQIDNVSSFKSAKTPL
jgi:hypothetical protein